VFPKIPFRIIALRYRNVSFMLPVEYARKGTSFLFSMQVILWLIFCKY